MTSRPMSNIDKRPYRADGGDISTGRLREIADNPYGDEEKCWLAKRVLALLDELECKQTFQQAFFRQSLMYDVVVEAYEEAKEQIAKDVEIKARLCRESNSLFDRLREAEKRIAELESDNAYIRNRHKELDLLIGKNILVMQAAIIELQGTGDARKGLAWIYNTLFGPGELPDESEKDAQAYFDRKYAPLDEELMKLHRWFWEQSEAERAAAAGKGE